MRTATKVGTHPIQGISDEFIPEIVKLDQLDEIVDVWDGDAILQAQALCCGLGLAVGISSGANFLGAAKILENVEIPAFNRDSLPNPLVGTFPTKDGRFIILVLLQADRYWPDLCAHLERLDLLADPRFKDAVARYEHREECIQVLREVFRTKSYDEWCERLQTLEGVWAPLQTPLELHNDPQAIANDFFTDLKHSGGPMKVLASPVRFYQNPASVRTPAPEVGQHTEEILLNNGYTREEIAALKEQQVIL